jgi:hypothetical protein
MSYRRTSRAEYRPRRIGHILHSPATHQRFRSDWETGLATAMTKAESLRREGWTVDVERGALVGGQAKRLSTSLEARGYETQPVEVAKWAGEDVVFLAYRPKPGMQPAPPPPPQPQQVQAKILTPEQVLDAYKKAFWKGTPRPDDVDNGAMIGQARTTIMMTRNASPSKDYFITISSIFDKTRPIEGIAHASKLVRELSAQKARGKKWVLFGTRPEDEVIVDIDYVRKGLKVLGGGKISVRGSGNDSPMFFTNEHGDKFGVAPVIMADVDKEHLVKFPEILQPPAPAVTT